MSGFAAGRWRRDLMVGGLASLLTALVLVPVAWASHRSQKEEAEAARQEVRAAALLAQQKAAEAEEHRARAQRALVEQAADFAGMADRADAEAMRVMTDAVAPEVPKDAWILIDKKASTYAVGDIVVVRDGDKNYLGRVVALDKSAGRMTVARNGEKNRDVKLADVLGRGVLNTR